MSTANENTPSIAINSQYIKDLSFEIPHAPEIFGQIEGQPELKVDINIDTQKLEKNDHTVTLNLALNADINNKKLFILELSYEALVSINVPEEHIDPVLGIEIPRLMFPFARQIVAQCLSDGGLPPVLLSPIDFAAVYAARHQEAAKQ